MSSSVVMANHPWMPKIPFDVNVVEFSPRWRVVTQIVITMLYVASLYVVYASATPIISGVGHSGMKLSADADPPAWAFLAFPLLGIIPAVYTFLFLKYNFLQ